MNLEQRIKEDRKVYDQIESVPHEAMWAGIDQRLRQGKRMRRLLWISAAAAVVLCLIVPLTVLDLGERAAPVSSPAAEQLQRYERQYARLATERISSLDMELLDPQIRDEIATELAELDEMYAVLKADISNVPNAEALIETAIRFHERRLRILELLAKEIENQKRNLQYDEEIQI